MNEIIAQYREKAGNNFNFHRFDLTENRAEDIKCVLESGSLFESKKLVVIEYAFAAAESFPQIKSAVAAARHALDTILILWDGALDNAGSGRLKEIHPVTPPKPRPLGWRGLTTESHISASLGEVSSLEARSNGVQDAGAKSQEFRLLAPRELKKWLEEEARTRGVALKPDDFLRLASWGADLWRIANELDKMALLNGRNTQRNISFSVEPPTIFHLGDVFFTSRAKALPALFDLLDGGQDEFNTFSYLSGQARNLYLVKSCEEQKKVIPKSIAPHPYVVKKSAAITRTIPAKNLEQGVKRFFEEDFKIKIGLSRPKESLVHILFSSR